ncbi:hypothetical protein PAE9249_05425 [Paenibacillus sp. CECT 9249]|nr:hypothetical protein PAE9249_05425 [Paenibacillus sp. CECT 9249]
MKTPKFNMEEIAASSLGRGKVYPHNVDLNRTNWETSTFLQSARQIHYIQCLILRAFEI